MPSFDVWEDYDEDHRLVRIGGIRTEGLHRHVYQSCCMMSGEIRTDWNDDDQY